MREQDVRPFLVIEHAAEAIAIAGRCQPRRHAGLVDRVHVGAFLDQQREERVPAAIRRAEQRVLAVRRRPARIGTKPVVVAGTVISAGGLYWLSQIPVDGSYLSDILPGLLTISIGMGGVFTGLTTAANAGVDQDKAGLAAGLLNTGQQLGAALGLAILSAVATAETKSVLSAGDGLAQAATHGYQRALLVGAFIVLAATVVALLTPNSRETTAAVVEEEPTLDLAA